MYRGNKNEKRWAYKKRIIEAEHASFTPLVLSAIGAMLQAASMAYKRIASLLAETIEGATPL